jgi:hypothetical protein
MMLIGLHLIGAMGMYLIGVHLVGAYHIGVHFRGCHTYIPIGQATRPAGVLCGMGWGDQVPLNGSGLIPSFLPVNMLVNLIAVNKMDPYDSDSSDGVPSSLRSL